MPYRIELKESAVKELERLPAKSHYKIIEHLVQLEQNPRVFGSEKLTGIDAYKLRVGSYRIVYEIDDPNEVVRW
jgi:mRNA interferase RelE/StbE